MNDFEDEKVGSMSLQFTCSLPCELGRVRNSIVFYMKVGDDPNWWWAQRLMPGAVVEGRIAGVVNCDSILKDGDSWPSWDCELHVCGSIFRTVLLAQNRWDALTMCRDIGGLILKGARFPTFWEKTKLFLKYYWLRRPIITRRDPLSR